MYFISRNNSFYQYIAHTNTRRRYCATLFLLAGLGFAFLYGIYKPLTQYIVLYKIELARLQKQQEDEEILSKGNRELSAVIFQKKKHVGEHIFDLDGREKECSKQMQFVFDAMALHGLMLNSYGSCKEKDRKWYTKEISHCQVTGSMQNVLSFLKAIKDSDRMVQLSHISISRVKDDVFQLGCDVEIVLVKG